MTLIRMTYFSRMRLDHWRTGKDGAIAEILDTSTANNRRDGLTGALVCDDRWFAQVLEGAESAVSNTFERILRDPRHCDLSLVTLQPVTQRRYPRFPMIGIFRSEDNGGLFRHYGEGDTFDPRQMRADRLSDLIDAVVSRSEQGGPSWTTGSATNVA